MINTVKLPIFKVIDNITLEKEWVPPKKLSFRKGQPFQYKSLILSPKFSDGVVVRYEAKIKNIVLYFYPYRVYLFNSIHKYQLGNNYTDFHLHQMHEAIESLSDETSIDWYAATTKKMEYGCNTLPPIQSIFNTLVSYKDKAYQSMLKNGKKYGSFCDFNEHDMKGYDKTFEVKSVEKIRLKESIFRWEVSIKKMRAAPKEIVLPLLVSELLTPETLEVLAEDAIKKFEATLKRQTFQYHKLNINEKQILACMRDEEVKADLKIHNKETYKRYRRELKRLMCCDAVVMTDDFAHKLREKFHELIYGTSSL